MKQHARFCRSTDLCVLHIIKIYTGPRWFLLTFEWMLLGVLLQSLQLP